MLTREEILSLKNTRVEKVECPEWGGCVYLKVMSGRDREVWESKLLEAKANKRVLPENNRALFVVLTACNETAEPLFTLADVAELSKQPWNVLDRITTAAFKLNAVTSEQIEELEKN